MDETPSDLQEQSRVRLRPPRYRLDWRAPVVWSIKGLLEAGLALVGIIIVAHFVPSGAQPWMNALIVAGSALLVLTTIVIPIWRYRVHRWEVTEDAVYAAQGWWRQEWRIAPISRLQTIDTVSGPIQRRFGLASLTVTTASAAGPIEIDGLDREVAHQLATKLTEVSALDSSDGT